MIHYRVKGVAQPTAHTCWEACTRMAFLWKFGPSARAQYGGVVAPFLALDRGLRDMELRMLCHRLGMSAALPPQHAISLSPVIWREVGAIEGHAMLLVAYDRRARQYANWDPFEWASSLNFGEDGELASAGGIHGKASAVSEKHVERRGVLPVFYYKH
jgi:hypothetical protein